MFGEIGICCGYKFYMIVGYCWDRKYDYIYIFHEMTWHMKKYIDPIV